MRKSVERQPASGGPASAKRSARDGETFSLDREAVGGAPIKGRICLITSNFPRWPGDSTTPFVLHLAQDLMDLGWRVDVLAPHAPGARRSEILDGVPVYRFRYLWPESWQTLCYQGGALVNLRARRSNWLKVPALVAFEWLALFARLLRYRYDLVNAHWIVPQGFVAAIAARPFGTPVVVTVHGSDVHQLRGGFVTWFKRVALRHAAAVAVNSSATELAVREIAPGLRGVHRIPMGVIANPKARPRPDEPRARFRRGSGPLLIFVGRLVEQKGVGDLIRAVGLLVDDLPDVTLLVLGEGQDRGAFEALTASLNLAERVSFHGWVDHDAVSDYLAAADIFVGPSKGAEGQGLTFIEAMLAGTPVVATACGGIVDAVRHEETGLLVEAGAPARIAEAIRRLARDPALVARLVRNGGDLVAREFTRERTAKAYSSMMTEQLAEGRS